MAVLGGTITYTRFRVETDEENRKVQFTRSINARRFQPLTPAGDEVASVGWVALEAPFDDEDDITREQYEFGDRIVLSLRQDTWSIPKARIQRETRLRINKMCEREGKPPSETGRAFRKQVQRQVTIELRRKTLPRTRIVECVWTPGRGEMRAFGRGRFVTEMLVAMFERTFGVRCHAMLPSFQAAVLTAKDEHQAAALEGAQPTIVAFAERR